MAPMLSRRGFRRTLACAVFSVLAVHEGGAFARDGLSPHEVAVLKSVSQSVISPDAAHIAYTLGVPRKPGEGENGAPWAELHVIEREGGRSRPFITGKVNIGSIAWTKDGTHIAYLAKRGDDKFTCLYAIPLGGGESLKLAELKANVESYSFSGDGKRVALVAAQPPEKKAEDLKEKGFNQEIYEEDWRPRRIHIQEIFKEENKEEPRELELPGSVFAAEWSPVADRLAVAWARTALVDDSYVGQRITIVDAGSGAALVEFDKRGKLQDVRWSPDGEHLAIVAGADINDPAARRLFVAPASGGAFRELFPELEGDVDHVQWMAADALLYVGSRGVKSVVGWTNLDGSDQRVLCQLGDVSLGGFHVSGDGMSASFTADTPERPAEVFTMDATDTAPARLTDHNPWLSDRQFAGQEAVAYTARDGLALEGILIRPLAAEPQTRCPLIVVVHGGPEAHYSNGWLSGYSTLGQVAAARGFAVFYPNYRGSTGRGLAFAKLSQGDPAGKEFDDLVDGVQHLVQSGLVDEKRVGVTGGSYGGYATAWCATRYSEHFAAGVMFVGISDKLSKWGTTDIPEEDYNVHTLKRVWEDWDFMLERSPIFHAANARTPLLIMHGKDDPRVDPGQSRELYRHLRVRGQAPVRLVYYPGEGHGNRKAAARLDYSLRLLGWMEHYLKGPGGDPPAYALDYSDPKESAEDVETEEPSAVGE